MSRALRILLNLAIVIAACEHTPASAKPVATYQVAGQVVEVSGSGADLRVTIAHEAIPAFKDRDGQPSRMPAMKMAFGVAAGVDARAFTADSKWKFVFDVDWGREPTLRIVRAERLPQDTRLELAR